MENEEYKRLLDFMFYLKNNKKDIEKASIRDLDYAGKITYINTNLGVCFNVSKNLGGESSEIMSEINKILFEKGLVSSASYPVTGGDIAYNETLGGMYHGLYGSYRWMYIDLVIEELLDHIINLSLCVKHIR